MTVKELIELLQQVDPNWPVKIEGCDCIGSAKGLSIEQDPPDWGGETWLLITRDNDY